VNVSSPAGDLLTGTAHNPLRRETSMTVAPVTAANMPVRTKSSLLTAMVLAGALFMAPPLQAQSPVSPGTLSISIGLQDSPQAGIWLTATTHTRLGLIGTAERTSSKVEGPGQDGDSATRMRYKVGPAVKWYILSSTQGISPFWYVAGSVGVDDPPEDTRTTTYDASGGFGVDWFPVPLVSFGAFTGMEFNYDRVRSGDLTTTSSQLGTMTAGLQMHIYF
jgi:hypothetical protein